MGLVALWHVESFQTRDRTLVPCIGRKILNPLCHHGSSLCLFLISLLAYFQSTGFISFHIQTHVDKPILNTLYIPCTNGHIFCPLESESPQVI